MEDDRDVWLDESGDTVVDTTSEVKLLLSTVEDKGDESEDRVLVWLAEADEIVVEAASELKLLVCSLDVETEEDV